MIPDEIGGIDDDDVKDDYEEIAMANDACEQDPHNVNDDPNHTATTLSSQDACDVNSNHITTVLSSLLDNTAAYLEEQDKLEAKKQKKQSPIQSAASDISPLPETSTPIISSQGQHYADSLSVFLAL